MNTKNIQKLDVLLNGVGIRLTENNEDFVEIAFTFFSGTRRQSGSLTWGEENLKLRFPGVNKEMTIQEFIDWILRQAALYDGLSLCCRERGNAMTVEADERGVRSRRESLQTAAGAPSEAPLREYVIRVETAAPLLRELGILTADGKLKNDKVRKFGQIDRFVAGIGEMLETVKKDRLLIVDCACGKSYLSFVLNHYICEVLHRKCTVIGVDISGNVIEKSRKTAEKLGWRNMEFVCSDIRDYSPPAVADLMVSLHACDTATDFALAAAVKSGCRNIACAPCCHRELLDTFRLDDMDRLLEHGVFRARFNDTLTDALRVLRLEAAGYDVRVTEFVSPLETPKNVLIRAVRVRGENPEAANEYHRLAALLGVNPALDREIKNANFV